MTRGKRERNSDILGYQAYWGPHNGVHDVSLGQAQPRKRRPFPVRAVGWTDRGGGWGRWTRWADGGQRAPVVPLGLLLFLLAAGVRLLHLWVLATRFPELVHHPVVDAAHFHRWALDILAGTGLANRTYFVHPVLPIFAAAIYRIVGPEPVAVAAAQCLLAGLSVVLWWRVLQRFLALRESLLAVLLLSLFRPLVMQSSFLETAELAMMLLAMALYAAVVMAERHPRWGWFATGICFAIAGLARGNIFFLAPVFAALAWRPAAPFAPRGWARAGLFLAGVALVVAAIGARNRLVGKEWVWTTGSLGPVLCLGNHPDNITGGHVPPAFLRPDPRYEETDWRAEAARQTGRVLSTSELSDYWRGRALVALAERPGFALVRFVRKLELAWASYELADNTNLAYLASLTWMKHVPLPGFSWIAGLAVFGFASGWSRRQRLWPLFGCVLAYELSLGVFYMSSRMRIVLMPFLCVFASVVFWRAWQAIRRRSWLWLAAGVIVVTATTVFAHQQVPRRARELEWSQALSLHAIACDEAGLGTRAGELRDRAVAIDPDNPLLRVNIGLAALRAGDAKGAFAACTVAAKQREDLSNAHDCLGIALAVLGQDQAAEREPRRAAELDPEKHSAFNLAVFLARTGRRAEATRILTDIVAVDPERAEARRALQVLR